MRIASFASLITTLAALVTLAACGGADPSPLETPGAGSDGGGGGDGGGTGDGGLPPDCNAKCAVMIPDGFVAVLAPPDRNTSCPAGWGSRDVVASPTAQDGACTCACNVTQNPDCTMGALHRAHGMQGQCTMSATTINVTDSSCHMLQYGIATSDPYYSASLDATGGTCSWDAKVDPKKVTARPARVCDPPPSCSGALCGKSNLCVAKAGDVMCPTSYPQKTLVGASPNVTCGACGGCSLKTQCTGTLKLFTDQYCNYGEADYPADGTCAQNPGVNMTFYSYEYSGSLQSATCAGNPPTSAPTPTLDQPTTVCCAK